MPGPAQDQRLKKERVETLRVIESSLQKHPCDIAIIKSERQRKNSAEGESIKRVLTSGECCKENNGKGT